MSRRERLRRLVPGVVTLLVAASLFVGVNVALATVDGDGVAPKYGFKEMPIALPAGYNNQKMNTVRPVNPDYHKIQSWISAVGASVAINDLTGHGRASSLCIVDTRTNQVIVTYAPTAPAEDRFTPFTLDASPLPVDATMAPTNCTPGDFNLDGRMDILVSYWGRTPILFMAKAGATTPSRAAYRPQELVKSDSPDGTYTGSQWYTDAIYVGDMDGSGHPSIMVGNYFVDDSDVLDPNGLRNVHMNDSLSRANNGGGDRVLRWVSSTTGEEPSATFVEEKKAIDFDYSTGWTLAIAGADMTDDGLPEVYIANDFGHHHLLYNKSTPGKIRFQEVNGDRSPTTPKSFVLGKGSFKGMGVDMSDLNRKGKFDMVVSNIDEAWGLEESNYVWENQTKSPAQMKARMEAGVAPFEQKAQQYGVAWTGWCWDVKTADFLNTGDMEILQATGFVKGEINRWPWLQELAMANDNLLSNPRMWPKVRPGDDLAGDNVLAFYARTENGKYANITKQLGLDVKIPTRAIATGDTRGNGTLDFAVARQWGPPAFYANTSAKLGDYVDLNLYRPATGGEKAGSGLSNLGTPAYQSTVTVKNPNGTQISQLDGGSGHGGYRSFGVHFGTGHFMDASTVEIKWRDVNGALHAQTVQLGMGTHNLMLTDKITEVPSR
jgi:enediyne biosynthesis protein E4